MRRLVWAAMGVALISMVFANCKKEDPTYSVQVTATEGGTVEGQNGEYKEGETVVFTAIPADGYCFSQWSDGSTDNPLTIKVFTSDISLTAKFIGVSATATEGGTVETQKDGNTFVFTAKPADGCYFAGWSDGNTNNPRTITIGNEDISLTALFFAFTVDLGLESGTLWATCNLGATAPWKYGDYYAWGETQTKDNYSWDTYKYCEDGDYEKITKYCHNAEFGNNGFTDALTTLEPADDAATAVLGAGWAMPTNADWEELESQCYWVWTFNYNLQSVSGYIVYKAKSAGDKGTKVFSDGTPSASYSLADAHIFLPAAGCRDGSKLKLADHQGYFWSSTIDDYPSRAKYCDFSTLFVVSSNFGGRDDGCSVRPIKRP